MKTPLTYDETWALIYDANGQEVAACHSNKQDAAEIVRRCNAHGDLVGVLDRILRAHDSGNNGAVMGEAVLCAQFADLARDVLAKARGTA